mmetsp:Transcript_41141/g.66162  ORF Transcript_41141/g.66162 Transcript_41141/m.66162 type:complete len:205 (-) Transcript_41141:646-1260(-)
MRNGRYTLAVPTIDHLLQIFVMRITEIFLFVLLLRFFIFALLGAYFMDQVIGTLGRIGRFQTLMLMHHHVAALAVRSNAFGRLGGLVVALALLPAKRDSLSITRIRRILQRRRRKLSAIVVGIVIVDAELLGPRVDGVALLHRNQNVLQLEVSVHDAFAVHILQCLGELLDDLRCFAFAEPARRSAVDELVKEFAAAAIFNDQV